jgi:hypothetical protein
MPDDIRGQLSTIIALLEDIAHPVRKQREARERAQTIAPMLPKDAEGRMLEIISRAGPEGLFDSVIRCRARMNIGQHREVLRALMASGEIIASRGVRGGLRYHRQPDPSPPVTPT